MLLVFAEKLGSQTLLAHSFASKSFVRVINSTSRCWNKFDLIYNNWCNNISSKQGLSSCVTELFDYWIHDGDAMIDVPGAWSPQTLCNRDYVSTCSNHNKRIHYKVNNVVKSSKDLIRWILKLISKICQRDWSDCELSHTQIGQHLR
jgi:hypothetical protein